MDNPYVEKLRKQIRETQYMKDACSKILVSSSTFNQWIKASKGYFCLGKRVEILADIVREKMEIMTISRSSDCIFTEKSSLKIADLRFPLLWIDEPKKRNSCNGFVFFTFQNEENLLESDLVEIDQTSPEIYTPGVIIPDVCINSVITICGYVLWYNSSFHSKFPSKQKDTSVSDVCLKFKCFGASQLVISDILATPSPSYVFSFQSENLKTFGSSSSCNASVNSSIFSSSTKRSNQLSQSQLGPGFYEWSQLSALFTIMPKKLEFTNFNPKMIVVSDKPNARHLQFEGPNIVFYPSHLSYACTPVCCISVLNTKLVHGEDDELQVVLFEDCSSTIASIKFNKLSEVEYFTNYFDTYTTSLKEYGPKIDVMMYSKSVYEITYEMVKSPVTIISQLRKIYKARN